MVSGLTDLGLTGICVRELSVLRGEQRVSFTRNLLGLRLVLAIVGVVLVTAFAFAAYGRLLGVGVLIAGCGMFLQNTQVLLTVSLSVRLRLGSLSVLEFARQVVIAAMIVVLVLAGAQLLAFLAVAALAALVMLVPTIALVRGDIPLMPSFDTRRWRALVGPMLTYSAAVLTATVYLRIAVVLVSLLCSAHQLGLSQRLLPRGREPVHPSRAAGRLRLPDLRARGARGHGPFRIGDLTHVRRLADRGGVGLALAGRGRAPGDRGGRRRGASCRPSPSSRCRASPSRPCSSAPCGRRRC